MTELFSLTAALFYLTATVVMLRQNSGPEDSPRGRSFEALLVYFAVGAHGFSLAPLGLSTEGINLALGTTLSLIGFVVVVLYLIARLLQPVHILGVLVFPAATLGVAIGWLFPGDVYAIQLQGTTGLAHILGAGLAYALLSLALAQALLLSAQDWNLKHKYSRGVLSALPPIQTMETVLFQLVYIGFTLLSITLISGALSSGQMFGNAFLFNHHTLLALLAWISLVILISGRLIFGWRGRIAVLWTGAGFALLALGYFGTRFVLEVMLSP